MSNFLKIGEVRALLADGYELTEYKETRNTFTGWAIKNQSVHGATVNALRGKLKPGDMVMVTYRSDHRSGLLYLDPIK